MRIGLMSGHGQRSEDLDELVALAQRAETIGFDTFWLANTFGLEAITASALIGRETTRIEIGTAVVPTYPRHPTVMAQQSLSAQAACNGRFTLGIGLSHQIVIETLLGLSYARRARHMREYLDVLMPLLRGEKAQTAGEEYTVNLALTVPGAPPVPCLVAALGPRMLEIAGHQTAGTLLWMTGEKTISEHIIPTIRAAANEAGRSAPRVVASLPIVLTDAGHDESSVRARIGEIMIHYGQIPSYRAMLDREGVAGPGDVALVGDEMQLDAALDRLASIGVTDFNAVLIPTDGGAEARTLAYLEDRVARAAARSAK
jgi:5,10-methylenetetrahydromethanopterin reductase